MMNRRAGLFVLVITYVGFVSLGLPDAVLGVAWPSIRQTFVLPESGLGAVLIASILGYFVSGFWAGRLIQLIGVGRLLAASSGLMALTLVGYAAAPLWEFFVFCAVFTGMGAGAIDSGLNAYAANNFSARHMNWLHGCYSVGAMLGPFIMTGVLAGRWPWRWGYVVVGFTLLLLTALFVFTLRWWQQGPGSGSDPTYERIGVVTALKHRLVWLQAALFFIYAGLEVTTGQWSYTVLTESRDMSIHSSGTWVGIYWGAHAAGRFLFGAVANRIRTDLLLRLSLLGVVTSCSLFAQRYAGAASLAGLALLGLALAPIYPCLMAQTPDRLGRRYAEHAIGFQVNAAMLGIVALPSFAGVLAQRLSSEVIGVYMLILAIVLALLHELLLKSSGQIVISER